MSIDKESSGLPEVNVHRPTTRVNLWMIAGIVMFLVVGAAAAYVIAQRAQMLDAMTKASAGKPPAPFIQKFIMGAPGAAAYETGSGIQQRNQPGYGAQ